MRLSHPPRSPLACALALLACTPALTIHAQSRRALLSIDTLNLAPDQYVASFRITTWGVNVLSTCHMPTSWKVEVEKLQDPEGLMTARSDVHGERLKELGQIFLVEIAPPSTAANGPHPAPFAGSVNIVSTDADARRVHRKLKPENFHLTDATACPVPTSPGP